MEGPDDVLALMDTGADGVVALVRDAGATFLAPIYHELTAIICTSGTLRSHIGIVSREFQVPCVMGCTLRRRRARRRHRGRARLLRRRGGRPWLTPRPPIETANRLIAYHAPISKALTAGAHVARERADPGHRLHRGGLRRVLPALPGDDGAHRRGDAGRGDRSPGSSPGCQVDPCYLWSIANFFLLGRKIMAMVDPQGDDPARTATVLDFWERAALAYRGDGTRQAWDTGTSRIYDDATVAALLDGAAPIVDDDHRAAVKRFNATLVNHLFLLYFDTRAGYGDTGPYPVPGAPGSVAARPRLLPARPRRLPVVRRGQGRPYHHLTAALVLEDVQSTLHRLRDVEPHARGLPRPPRRLRPVHHRRPAARRARARCPPTSTTASSRPCARRRPSTTATSRRWTATRRSAPAPTCTSASSGRSPRSPAWPTSSTGPCPATCRSRSTSSSRRWRARTPASRTTGRTTTSYPEDAPRMSAAPAAPSSSPTPTSSPTRPATSGSGASRGTSTSRTARARSAATCASGCTRTSASPGTGPAWSGRAGRSSRSSTTRWRSPRRRRWRSGPTACGPTTSSRRRSTT